MRTKKLEEVAILKMHLNTTENTLQYPLILQLTNEKATEVLREIYIEKPLTEYLFENVTPGKFRLRLKKSNSAPIGKLKKLGKSLIPNP